MILFVIAVMQRCGPVAVKIQKWGNSQGITIPKNILDLVNGKEIEM